MVAVVLGQVNGDRGDVQVGQALQRVLLTATVAGLGVSFVPHVVQVRSTREELGWLIGGTRPPQAVLQVRRGLPPPPPDDDPSPTSYGPASRRAQH